MLRYVTLLLLLGVAGGIQAFAQPNVYNGVTYNTPEEANQQRMRDRANAPLKKAISDANKAADALEDLDPSINTTQAESFYSPYIENGLKPEKGQKQQFKDFLKQKDTGIFLLVPEEKCGTIGSGRQQYYISPESAYYWFKHRVHRSASADLSLKNGIFQTGLKAASLGYFSSIGDLPIETIDLNNAEAQKLTALTLPTERNKLNEWQKNSVYSVPLKLNDTYLLRSAVYGQSDILIAFRVVSIEPNGNVLILWKQLQKNKVPTLK
jgi:hypothetical protein